MKKRLALLWFAAITLFTSTSNSQVSGTSLVMGAHWDNNTYIQGTVIFGKVNSSGPETVIARKSLTQGWATITQSLEANSVYDVTLLGSDGTQLVKFPIATALINPSNLEKAEIDLVCHVANRSLASAHISVSMTF